MRRRTNTTNSSSACWREATRRDRFAASSNGTCGSTRRGERDVIPDECAMTHFIDRRLNPKGKSLGNRQRFLRRARTQIREAVQKSLKDSSVADLDKDRKVRISTKGTKEPRFRLDPKAGGEHDFVLPGNKQFTPGDEIKKPPSGEGGGRGKEAADYAEGDDDFEFTMTQDEVLDIFFEDLELPNL